jgi:ribonucleoside-diphosphate reductase alpha chain
MKLATTSDETDNWSLINRGDKKIAARVGAKQLLTLAAEIAHDTGDPGIQFDDRMNIDNPVPHLGRIQSTNPCQPDFAKVLSPRGVCTFRDIDVGSTIWSGKCWTKVTHKVLTGIKPVFEYVTYNGSFIGTETHRDFQNGVRVEVKDAIYIDFCPTEGQADRHRPVRGTILNVRYLGDLPVWDIRVEAEEHSYWSDNLLVSNCSEFSAVNHSACNLSSMNLIKYFNTEQNKFDWPTFDYDVSMMVMAMDILVTPSYYPTEDIGRVTRATRPLGLGFSNLGALLVQMGYPYGSAKARITASEVTRRMTLAAYKKSVQLAKKLGPYEAYAGNEFLNDQICARLIDIQNCSSNEEAKLLKDMQKFGLRNSQLTLLAPCGTIGFAMDCETSGIEPLFSLCSIKTLAGGGQLEIIPEGIKKALHKAFIQYGGRHEQLTTWPTMELLDYVYTVNPELARVFDTANEISWQDHIDMMAACQKHLNSAISKTINMRNDCTVDDVFNAYVYAWKQGLKAVAIYRDGSKSMQPLTDTSKKTVKDPVQPLPIELPIELPKKMQSLPPKPMRKKLANTRDAVVHRFDISGFDGYLTVGMYDDGTPGEIFIAASKEGATMGGLLDSFAIAVSFALQHGVPLESLIEKFRDTTFQPNGFTNEPQVPMCSSIVDYIFRWLEKNFILKDLGDEFFEDPQEHSKVLHDMKSTKKSYDGPPCSFCGGLTQRMGTCYTCLNCGSTSGCS